MLAAGGSVRAAAEHARSAGTDDDTVLLHISPEEFDWIRSEWGDPEINPRTGLPEYSWLSKGFKSAKKFIHKVDPIAKWTDEKIDPVGKLKKYVTRPVLHYVRDKVLRPVANWMGFGNTWDAAFGVGDQSFGIDTFWDYAQHPTSGGKPGVDAGKAAGAVATGYTLGGTGGNTGKALGALSAVAGGAGGGGGGAPPGAPASSKEGYQFDAKLSPLPEYQKPENQDWFTYGERPEVNFFKGQPGAAEAAAPTGVTENGALTQVATPPAPAAQPIYTPVPADRGGISGAIGQAVNGAMQQLPQNNPNKPEGMNIKTGFDPYGLDDAGALEQYTGDLQQQPWHGVGPDSYTGFATGNLVRGPGTGRSDEIPAQLSDGEYVMDAETVALLGDGSTDEGARRLDEMRARLRKHKGQQLMKGEFSDNAKSPLEYIGGR